MIDRCNVAPSYSRGRTGTGLSSKSSHSIRRNFKTQWPKELHELDMAGHVSDRQGYSTGSQQLGFSCCSHSRPSGISGVGQLTSRHVRLSKLNDRAQLHKTEVARLQKLS